MDYTCPCESLPDILASVPPGLPDYIHPLSSRASCAGGAMGYTNECTSPNNHNERHSLRIFSTIIRTIYTAAPAFTKEHYLPAVQYLLIPYVVEWRVRSEGPPKMVIACFRFALCPPSLLLAVVAQWSSLPPSWTFRRRPCPPPPTPSFPPPDDDGDPSLLGPCGRIDELLLL